MMSTLRTIYCSQCALKGISFSVDFLKKGNIWIRGDPVRLKQVFINIFSNAVKFTKEGGVSVLVSAEPVASSGLSSSSSSSFFNFPPTPILSSCVNKTHIRVEITDTGIGIGPEELDNVFDRFAKANSMTVGEYGGSGLGLAISKNLAELMGGSIKVKSEKGKGTTFVVELFLETENGPPTPKISRKRNGDHLGVQVLVVEGKCPPNFFLFV
jgi:signal transduction histidine kinase